MKSFEVFHPIYHNRRLKAGRTICWVTSTAQTAKRRTYSSRPLLILETLATEITESVGIRLEHEARQRSTPPFIEHVKRECLERFDVTGSPAAVLGRLEDAIEKLHAGGRGARRAEPRRQTARRIHTEHPERGGAETGS